MEIKEILQNPKYQAKCEFHEIRETIVELIEKGIKDGYVPFVIDFEYEGHYIVINMNCTKYTRI